MTAQQTYRSSSFPKSILGKKSIALTNKSLKYSAHETFSTAVCTVCGVMAIFQMGGKESYSSSYFVSRRGKKKEISGAGWEVNHDWSNLAYIDRCSVVNGCLVMHIQSTISIQNTLKINAEERGVMSDVERVYGKKKAHVQIHAHYEWHVHT